MQDKTRNIYTRHTRQSVHYVIHVNQYITSYMSISTLLLNNLTLSHGSWHYLTINSAKSMFHIYGSRLSHFLDKRRITIFLIWYSKYVTWYSYISSNVTFSLWKTWYNDHKFVIPGIWHEKIVLTKFWLSCFPFLHGSSLCVCVCALSSRFSKYAVLIFQYPSF